MVAHITLLTLHYLFSVNCYLLTTDEGTILIDTGPAPRRQELYERLVDTMGTSRGLRLIVLTHGHTDHCGNCASLRESLLAPIAIHAGDAGKVQHGDMFWREEGRQSIATTVARKMLFPVGLSTFDRFDPDLLLVDGQHLGEYGLDARVLHLPGHTPGSLGVLTSSGDLFCGDLFTNTKTPEPNSMAEDKPSLRASVERLRRYEVDTVYPGHGKPFPFAVYGGGIGG